MIIEASVAAIKGIVLFGFVFLFAKKKKNNFLM